MLKNLCNPFKFIICLLFLFCINCSSQDTFPPIEETVIPDPIKPNVTILMDDSFSAEKQDLLRKAAFSWPASFEFTFKTVPSSSLFPDAVHPDIVSIFNVSPSNEYFGWCQWSTQNNGAQIRMRTDLNLDLFLVVAKHEFGHAFHLPHYNGTNESIMHPYVYSGERIACQDLVSFCLIWKCKVSCDPAVQSPRSFQFVQPMQMGQMDMVTCENQ